MVSPQPKSTDLIYSAIERLKNAALGHSPLTVTILNRELADKYRQQPNQHFSECYNLNDPQGNIDLQNLIKNATPPQKLFIPLASGGDHITGLVVDIDKNGKVDTLFFNSLGERPSGGSKYHEQAKKAIQMVRAQYPEGKDHISQIKLQDYQKGDNFCGDWTLWCFEQIAMNPQQSLGNIKDNLNSIGNDSLHGQEWREININTLESRLKKLRGEEVTPPANVHRNIWAQNQQFHANENVVTVKSASQLDPANGSFLNLTPRTREQIGMAIKEHLISNPAVLNAPITMDSQNTWKIPLRNNTSAGGGEIKCINDKKLTVTNLDPRDESAVDAYVKSIKAMAKGRVPEDKISIKVDELPPDLALALAKAAKNNGLATNVPLTVLNQQVQQKPGTGAIYNLGNEPVQKVNAAVNTSSTMRGELNKFRQENEVERPELSSPSTTPRPH